MATKKTKRSSKIVKKKPTRTAAGPKKAAKAPAKRAKKAAKAPAKRAKRAVVAPALSAADRAGLLKPPEDYVRLVEATVSAWSANSRTLRIDGRSSRQLASLQRAALRARAREDAVRAKLESQLRPLVDARLVAEDRMWSEVLDLYRLVRATTKMRPELEHAFQHLAEHFARSPRREDAGAGAPEAAPAPADG